MAEFERLMHGARTPWDAVVVEVTQIFGRSVADVAAVDHIACLPVPVRQALDEAEVLRDKLGLKRIVVRIGDENLWNPAWGKLVEPVR
ncbi:hypothetical protein [Devosia rhizoryzae]|uniref:Uncharacterized protein n=1 Tax=Devosia rhizoryzae TaxID=2774137 RepID=A0ABX7C484_9HYPH|nr:hypothetical protein [Devosia rhizoryzae]QQR38069.1 hypothetical protein JI748_09690 [Devosia rhizoryzae]